MTIVSWYAEHEGEHYRGANEKIIVKNTNTWNKNEL
jgi:hypothetical protein